MAQGKRREERIRAYQLAAVVWTLANEPLTEATLHEFVRCGALSGGPDKRIPHVPGVDEKVAEIHANGGRLIIPIPPGTTREQ